MAGSRQRVAGSGFLYEVLFPNRQRIARAVLADVDAAPLTGRFEPREVGQAQLPVGALEARLDPIGPVATVAIDGSQNAALLVLQMLGITNKDIAEKLKAYKNEMANK